MLGTSRHRVRTSREPAEVAVGGYCSGIGCGRGVGRFTRSLSRIDHHRGVTDKPSPMAESAFTQSMETRRHGRIAMINEGRALVGCGFAV